jgi:N-acetyl-anhydromuramyl-L-alanine amidase AmpD
MSERIHPSVDVTMYSPFRSSRNGTKIRLLVVHATASHNQKGLSDLKAIGGWFQNPNAQVSAHACTDNEGNSARYVDDVNKAWHCAQFNSVSLGLEQILPGNGTEITDALYRETARWLAHWSVEHHIRLRKARRIGTRIVLSGVARHSDLGALGGGHDDPGPNYDLAKVLRYARHYRRIMRRRKEKK